MISVRKTCFEIFTHFKISNSKSKGEVGKASIEASQEAIIELLLKDLFIIVQLVEVNKIL